MIDRQTVPFKITNIFHGLKEIQGLIGLEENGLKIEYEEQDSIFGMIKSGVSTIKIPFDNLQEITFKKGWFGGKIVLEGNSMEAFNGLPGTEPGSRTLEIKRSDRDEAQNLISHARMRLSEYKLEKMEGER
ncbi:hypothetical protein LQ318_16490 [Aliifodinibius salicampi]|uniref:Uncharacterized protein n=1 Tax=Fodinibius salicampi TaxID=1920655 RepID=A0ABT3Q328_9BACT|nr:hypothetical protein [Fodinibius salicampi]MCW9714506.1 hypothetical protein [Fodinibius salicampi]